MELQEAAIMLDFCCDYTFIGDFFDEIVALGYDYSLAHNPLMLDDLRGIWPRVYFTSFNKE